MELHKSVVAPKVGAGLPLAALGAVALLGTQRARGAVNYTSASLPVSSADDIQNIDFDHDGNLDIYLAYVSPSNDPVDETNLKVDLSSKGVGVVVDSTSNASGANNAVAFANGQSIGPTLPSGDSYNTISNFDGGNLITPVQTGTGGEMQTSPSGNFPQSAGEKFIGVDFTAGSNSTANPNYGYIAYETTNDSSTGSLAGEVLGYAYETQPGVAITAGAVPEPSSLALLAAGAIGLRQFRGRRWRVDG